MKKCPFCAEMIQDEAVKCRYCGEFLDGRTSRQPMVGPPIFGYYRNYEFRSKMTLFGWPLVHICLGINPETGRLRVARGIIAIGNIAIGVLAVGGMSLGVFAFGGISLGLIALGGIALGGIAVGGVAFAAYLAVGGLAISLSYAIGGLAVAPHVIGAMGTDPDFMQRFMKFFDKSGP